MDPSSRSPTKPACGRRMAPFDLIVTKNSENGVSIFWD